jgi:hypothetical protein
MTNIEAKRCPRQYFENPCEISSRLADRFSLIHILDAQKRIEGGPGYRSSHGVRMNNNRPAPSGDAFKQLDRGQLKRRVNRTWGMKSHIGESAQI